MRGLSVSHMLAGAALLALPAGLGLARQATTVTAPVPSASQALVDRTVAAQTVPGLLISIGRGDAPAEIHAAGNISNEPGAAPVGPDSLWRVYSMTKPITGIAAMILVEEGKIRLDQPVSDFIPGFKTMRVLDDPEKSLASHPATHPVTIRNLLTHTAGLGYNIITTGPLLDEYNRLGINPAAVNVAFEAKMRPVRPASLKEFADRVSTLPLIAEPGSKWSYSIGLDVMGRVIEVASGMPFDQFLQTRIFTPLKMHSSFFTVPRGEIPRFATNYTTIGGKLVPLDVAASSVWLDPPSFPYGGAGLVMSARDYDRFLHMLLDGGSLDGVRILKPETVQLAMSNLLPPGADTSALKGLAGAQMGFGAGGSVYLSDAPNGPSKGTYGWAGAAGTLGWVDPVKRVRGVLMVNYFNLAAPESPLRADTSKAVYTDLAR